MQLRKHIKKESKAMLIRRAKDALRFNPNDTAAQAALNQLEK